MEISDHSIWPIDSCAAAVLFLSTLATLIKLQYHLRPAELFHLYGWRGAPSWGLRASCQGGRGQRDLAGGPIGRGAPAKGGATRQGHASHPSRHTVRDTPGDHRPAPHVLKAVLYSGPVSSPASDTVDGLYFLPFLTVSRLACIPTPPPLFARRRCPVAATTQAGSPRALAPTVNGARCGGLCGGRRRRRPPGSPRRPSAATAPPVPTGPG